MTAIDSIIREICESDPSDWREPSTVCINVDDLRLILESCIGPEAARATADRDSAEVWQPIATAPEGKLLVVCWLDKDDPENPERHAFDFIEDGGWVRHNDDYDHFLCVAPPGSRGPSADAPYTGWMSLPAIAAIESQSGNGESS